MIAFQNHFFYLMSVPTELIPNTITYSYYSGLSWLKREMDIVFQGKIDLLETENTDGIFGGNISGSNTTSCNYLIFEHQLSFCGCQIKATGFNFQTYLSSLFYSLFQFSHLRIYVKFPLYCCKNYFYIHLFVINKKIQTKTHHTIPSTEH